MKKEKVSKEQALKDVLSIIKRMAMLHYSYARTLIEELGEERGKKSF